MCLQGWSTLRLPPCSAASVSPLLPSTLHTMQAWAQAFHAANLSAGVPIKTAVPQHVLDAAYDNTFSSQPLQFGQAHSHKVGAAISSIVACV